MGSWGLLGRPWGTLGRPWGHYGGKGGGGYDIRDLMLAPFLNIFGPFFSFFEVVFRVWFSSRFWDTFQAKKEKSVTCQKSTPCDSYGETQRN